MTARFGFVRARDRDVPLPSSCADAKRCRTCCKVRDESTHAVSSCLALRQLACARGSPFDRRAIALFSTEGFIQLDMCAPPITEVRADNVDRVQWAVNGNKREAKTDPTDRELACGPAEAFSHASPIHPRRFRQSLGGGRGAPVLSNSLTSNDVGGRLGGGYSKLPFFPERVGQQVQVQGTVVPPAIKGDQ